MSADRELLELAAKAADIKLKGWTTISGVEEAVIGYDAYAVETWNPLTDDGDALRLAVELRLLVNVTEFFSHATNGSHLDGEELHENSDPYAATRRAIVRAAAEIGKAMP